MEKRQRSDREHFLAVMEQTQAASESAGRDAFAKLSSLQNEKLARGDEVVIASRLFHEVIGLKKCLRAKGMSLGEFCGRYELQDGGERSKELHRLTLPPNTDGRARQLRRSALNYRRLIQGISEQTQQSVSVLADRVLRGTQLHPQAQMGSLLEVEKVQVTLQLIVDRIDEEFDLYPKFMSAAQFKAAHVAAGGNEYWPIDFLWIGSEDPDYQACVQDAKDPRKCYWGRDIWGRGEVDVREFDSVNPPSPITLTDSEFFYVPHVPLGIIDYCYLPDGNASTDDHLKAVEVLIKQWRAVTPGTQETSLARESSIRDGWDNERKCPVGQFGAEGIGRRFAWLVIYPTWDNSRLMPMIYVAYDEGGPSLLPLNTRALENFRNAVWLDESRHMSVFDRIKEMLGHRQGMAREIEDGFRRTAPWFDHNPLFKLRQKLQKEQQDDMAMLDAYCKQLWERK